MGLYLSAIMWRDFFSYETLSDILIINNDSHAIGFQLSHQHSKVAMSSNVDYPGKLRSQDDSLTCDCSPRSKMSDRPTKLPCEATVAYVSNIGECSYKAKQLWPLQQMSGPPIEIHLEKNAHSCVCHTQAHVAIHWLPQVEAVWWSPANRVGHLERQ